MHFVGLHIWINNGTLITSKASKQQNTQRINQMQQVQIKSVKQGAIFSKREDGPEYIRNHYNRKDAFGPACFSVSRYDDVNSETFLKPNKLVWVDWF